MNAQEFFNFVELNALLNLTVHYNFVIAYFESHFMLLERDKREQMEKEQFRRILRDHEKVALQLEAQKKELEQREKQLQQRRAQNDSERRKLYHDRKMVILLFLSVEELGLCLDIWGCLLALTVKLYLFLVQSQFKFEIDLTYKFGR